MNNGRLCETESERKRETLKEGETRTRTMSVIFVHVRASIYVFDSLSYSSSKTRNVTGSFVHFEDFKHIIFDIVLSMTIKLNYICKIDALLMKICITPL